MRNVDWLGCYGGALLRYIPHMSPQIKKKIPKKRKGCNESYEV
jgi:hypothetical protein